MEYKEILSSARGKIGPFCKVCPVCDGRGCGNVQPGPGSKPPGNGAARNYDAWQRICVNMDTICSNAEPDTAFQLFGHSFGMPVFAAPIGALTLHYSEAYDDFAYNSIMVPTCAESGIAAFTGDNVDPDFMNRTAKTIADAGGLGIPTIKPWNLEAVLEKLDILNSMRVFAAAMDIDGAGLPFLKKLNPNAGSKTVEELREIIGHAQMPFILKGIMTPKGAEKAIEAGAAGIVVSNHGGRVLGQCPGTAEVLPEVVKAVNGRIAIFVDGGIRSGVDVFKALAMGADAVLIGRPFVPMVYGGETVAVKIYIEKIAAELRDTMTMCGAHSLKEITPDMVSFP